MNLIPLVDKCNYIHPLTLFINLYPYKFITKNYNMNKSNPFLNIIQNLNHSIQICTILNIKPANYPNPINQQIKKLATIHQTTQNKSAIFMLKKQLKLPLRL